MFRKKRSSSQPAQSRNYNAQQGATSAAAIAYLTGQPQGGGGNLSAAAAAAALRSQTTTPTPIGELQTKRMARRGSTSSFGSNAGSVARQPFGGLQRAPSRGSMTERSFRSPSPGGRNRISSISSDIPPLPTHNRTGSLEQPYSRVMSPEPAKGARSISVDRASRTAAPRRVGAVPRPSLANVPEEGKEPEEYGNFNRQSSTNYSRPMSPTPSMSSYRSAPARPASASGYYYDPATRKLVGKPPATASPAVKAARASAQQAFVPPPLPASYTAARTRPTSVANPSTTANRAPATLTPAQLRAQHMRAGPPISISTPVNRPRASSNVTTSTQGARPGSSLGPANNIQPARPGSSLGVSSNNQLNRPGSSMGRLQTNAINSNTSLASSRPAGNNNNTATRNTSGTMGRLQTNAVSSNTSLASYKPTTSNNAVASNTISSAAKQKFPPSSAVSSPSSMSAVQQLMQRAPQSPSQQPQQIRREPQQTRKEEPVTVPSPTQETMRAFHTRAAAMIAGTGVDKTLGSPTPAQIYDAPQKQSAVVNGVQRDRSTSLTAPSLSAAANGVNRTQSVSPSRNARFANTTLAPSSVHEPSSRSLSPAKSAMKGSSIRTLSPAGSIKHSDSDSKSLVSDDGSSSMRKKKSVRISLTEDQIPPVPQVRNVSAPLASKGSWTVTDNTDMGTRPDLPTFGSVRARNKTGKDGRPMGQRPLSNVYETDPSRYQDEHDEAEEMVSSAPQNVSNGYNAPAVNGLGLNGISSNVPAFMQNLPGYSGNTLSNNAAHATKFETTTDHVPSIAVMPATPRVDEMPTEPHLEHSVQNTAHPFPDTSEPATNSHVEHTRAQEDLPQARPKQTFLSDFVRSLRPTSEVYDDRTQDVADLSSIQTPDVHASSLPATRQLESEAPVPVSNVHAANDQANLQPEEGLFNSESSAAPTEHVSKAVEDTVPEPNRVYWPVGVSEGTAPLHHEVEEDVPMVSDASRGIEDSHVSDLEETISNQDRRPQAVRLDTNPVPFEIGSATTDVPVKKVDEWEHVRAHWGNQTGTNHAPDHERVVPSQQDFTNTEYASEPLSPPLSPAVKLDRNPLQEADEEAPLGEEPDPSDWEGVRAYWSSLSERKKLQLEREASVPVPTASPNLASPSAAVDDRSVPEAPLPPWPDHQYQQSVIKSTTRQPPTEQSSEPAYRGPDPFPTPAAEQTSPPAFSEEEPMPSQIEHHIPRTLRGPDAPLIEQTMPRTLREQDPAQRQAEHTMPRSLRGQESMQQQQQPEQNRPRTMRGPDPGPFRQMSNQGPPRGDRPPMMRPASSSGPPPSERPPMMRPGSSSGPPQSRQQFLGRPESAAGSVGGRSGSAAANYPLKSALKKTNAPIVLAPGALSRNLSTGSADSDSSFRQGRIRRKESSASAQGGRYSMRRSMRDSAPDDRVMSPTPSNNGPTRNGPGRMSMRTSMRDQDAPTLRTGPPGGRAGSNRNSLRQQPAPQPASKSRSAPNLFTNRRADSSDEEEGGRRPGYSAFKSRIIDSDDEDFQSPPRSSKSKTFSPGRNSGFGGRGNMSAIKESPTPAKGPQGSALFAGTLRGGGAADVTPTKSKRATFSTGTKQDNYEYSASAPTTPARPGLSERTSSLMRRMSTSTPTSSQRVYGNAQDYPPPPPIPEQYREPTGTFTDKKGNTAEEIARKMWEKQQKSGKSQLPIVSQRTGKKKKFQGLRRILGIED